MSGDSFFLSLLPGVTPEAIDPAYRNVRDLPHAAGYRDFVEELWARFRAIAEPGFRLKAATALHPAFWEMYLYAALTERGLRVGRASLDGPDFFVDTPAGRVWIEATAPGPGEGPDAVPPPDYSAREAREVPEDKILMRFTGAMREKAKQFERAATAGLVSRGEPYVVAINSHDADPAFGGYVPYYLTAFLPIGHLAIAIDNRTGEVVERRLTYRDTLTRQSGKTVPTDTFLSGAYPAVSAFLHSRVDCANFPGQFGGDFAILHNPRAAAPLGDDLFAFCKQTRVGEDGEEFWLEEREPATSLMSRPSAAPG